LTISSSMDALSPVKRPPCQTSFINAVSSVIKLIFLESGLIIRNNLRRSLSISGVSSQYSALYADPSREFPPHGAHFQQLVQGSPHSRLQERQKLRRRSLLSTVKTSGRDTKR
jgi:hypothetical protein